jgi:6-phosphogluconolactonase
MASGVVAPVSTSKGAGVDVPPHLFQYPTAEGNAQVVVYITPQSAATGLAKSVAEAAAAAIKAKGTFTLVLSGGSLINSLGALADAKGIDWSKWYVFWVDERNVSHSSADSNYGAAQAALLGRVPVPPGNVYAIAEGLTVQQAAKSYEGRLAVLPPEVLPRDGAGWPVFDLVLLGVGPDGHVASLFPNAAATAYTGPDWVLPISDSPKPPPERITFSLPVINAAKEVQVVAVGEGKAEIVQRVLEVQALPGALPAQLVRPASGTLKWVLDVASAQNLDIGEWASSKAFPRSQ